MSITLEFNGYELLWGTAMITGIALLLSAGLIAWAIRSISPDVSLLTRLSMSEPHRVRVLALCKECRGSGREALRVDPREQPRTEDAKLVQDDFPVCSECKGMGWTESHLLELSAGSVRLTPKASSSAGPTSPAQSTDPALKL